MKNIETVVRSLKNGMKKTAYAALAATFAGCAGVERGCSSCMAENFAVDWIVVQFDYNGKPFNCWKLENTSITNEAHSDGIYWLEPTGNLVHISGWYNRVQVQNKRWKDAAQSLGINLDYCNDGKYNASE